MKIKDCLTKISEINKGIFDGSQGSPNVDWWETGVKSKSGKTISEGIFNESRLYSALGKQDARSVLSIWRRYVETIEMLRIIEKKKRAGACIGKPRLSGSGEHLDMRSYTKARSKNC